MAIKQCKITGESFSTTPSEDRLYAQFDSIGSDFSVLERFRIMLCFLNSTHYYWGKDYTLKGYGVYSPDSNLKVLEFSEWQQLRKVGAFFELGFDWNPRVPFFDQLKHLGAATPRPVIPAVNVDHLLGGAWLIDVSRAAFVTTSARIKDCFASALLRDCEKVGDSVFVTESSRCFDCIDVHKSDQVVFSRNSYNCFHSAFLTNCTDCRYCLLCSNLEGKEYHFENRPISKADFEAKYNELKTRSGFELLYSRFEDFKKNNPPPAVTLFGKINYSTGNYLLNASQAEGCYACAGVEQSANLRWTFNARNCVDILGFSEGIEESASSVLCGGGARRLLGSFFCWGSVEDIFYSSFCTNSRELIGCVGLDGAEYCILNKRYSKSEYADLKQQIISKMKKKRTWGSPLPFKLSDFSYNESDAQDLFPLTRVQAALFDLKWNSDLDKPVAAKLLADEKSMAKVIEPPENLAMALENKDAVLICELSGVPYQFLPGELELCKDLGVCPSLYCPAERRRQALNILQCFQKGHASN